MIATDTSAPEAFLIRFAKQAAAWALRLAEGMFASKEKAMSGRRPGNVRSGHRAEALGVYAFTEFCAVARVPLEEDIGWDAVCTILNPDPKDARRLWAGASCWVQFKTESTPKDEYDADGKKWLASLPLPLFYCTVNKEERRFRVYTTYNAWPGLLDLRRKMMLPDQPAGTPLVLGLGDGAVEGGGIPLGPPILEWRLEQKDFPRTAREVLGAWIALSQKQLLLGAIGVDVKCEWTSNAVPVEQKAGQAVLNSGSDVDKVFLENLAPHLGAFGLFLASKKDIAEEAVPKLLDAMQKAGRMDSEVASVSEYFETLKDLREKAAQKERA